GPDPELARPVADQRFGAGNQRTLDESRMEKKAQGQNRLRRLAQTHLVREQGGVSWHQKGDPFQLIWIRLQRQTNLSASEATFQRRLQQVKKALLEYDRVLGRLDARDGVLGCRLMIAG